MVSLHDGAGDGVLLLLLVLPWLYPYASGPSPSVPPWLFSLGCAVLLWQGRACLSADRVLQGWRWAAALSAAVGLLQYTGGAAHFGAWMAAAPEGVAFGNLRQRNQFATLTSIGLAAVLWSARSRPAAAAKPRPTELLWVALLAAGNAASSSRTGAVQLLLLAGLVSLWGGWRHAAMRRLYGASVLAYGLATLVLPFLIGAHIDEVGLWARLRDGDPTCGGRTVLWSNVLHLISLRPWTGWGWGELGYAHFITPYPGPRFCDILDNAHNLPLHLAVELGVPLALLLLGLGAYWLWRQQPWRETEPTRQAAWAILALIALHSLLEYPLWYGPFQLTVVLCLYLLLRPESVAAGLGPRRRGLERALALTLLLAIAYAAWDYHRVSQLFLPPAQRTAAYRDHPLVQARASWLFRDQVRFAEYTLTPLTRENAAQLYALGLALLHYSPEARVVEKLIDSALLLGRAEEARFYQARYQAAFPREYARWQTRQAQAVPPVR